MEQHELYELHAASSGPEPFLITPRNLAIAHWIARALPENSLPQPRLLEIGFGDANLSLTLCQQIRHCRVHGVDISAQRVERARALAHGEQLHERASFTTLDADRELASLGAASTDGVIAMDVLEHVFDVFAFVQQLARITRPQGLVLLRVPNVAYVKHRVALLRGKLPVTASWFGPREDLTAWRDTWGWDGGHLHYFTLATLRALLRSTGLQPLTWRDPGTKAEAARRIAPGLLLGNLCVLARRA
jgi:cyclopropane fatty-acyl-phospholipid synthase-like methyltransferase